MSAPALLVRLEVDQCARLLDTADPHVPGPPRRVRRDDAAWIRRRWEELTGRRTGSGWDLMHGLPVRRASR